MALAAFAGLAMVATSSPVPDPDPKPYRGYHHHKGVSPETGGQSGQVVTKNDLNLPTSKQVPKLISGYEVITVDPSIVVESINGTYTYPPNPTFNAQAKQDILRGMLSFPGKNDYGWEYQNTLVVLDVPTTYENYQCKFHFVYGGGDFVRGRVALWQLKSPPEEFKTTWDNKPAVSYYIGWFLPGLGEKVSMTDGDSTDAKWDFGLSDFVKPGDECGPDREECKSLIFPCKWVTGKYGYEMQFDPEMNDAQNVGASAWSMNKGLMIEIVDAPQTVRDYSTPCCKSYDESQGKIYRWLLS